MTNMQLVNFIDHIGSQILYKKIGGGMTLEGSLAHPTSFEEDILVQGKIPRDLNFYTCSLKNLIKIFKERTMIIYDAILKGLRVIFVGYD